MMRNFDESSIWESAHVIVRTIFWLGESTPLDRPWLEDLLVEASRVPMKIADAGMRENLTDSRLLLAQAAEICSDLLQQVEEHPWEFTKSENVDELKALLSRQEEMLRAFISTL